jgi:hypothetical protein
MEKPAHLLFQDFAGTARVVTFKHYRRNLRLAATDQMLKPASEFFSDGSGQAPRQDSQN